MPLNNRTKQEYFYEISLGKSGTLKIIVDPSENIRTSALDQIDKQIVATGKTHSSDDNWIWTDELIPKKSGGIFVRYFDPAQYVDLTERPFYYDTGFTPLEFRVADFFGSHNTVGSLYDPPRTPIEYITGHVAPHKTYVLDGDKEDWATTYREVLEEDEIQFDALYSSDYVSGKGYPVAPDTNASEGYRLNYTDGGWQQLWYHWDTDNTTDYKVTMEDDFAADEVEFSLTHSCDVFLSPHPKFWEGRSGEWLTIPWFPPGTFLDYRDKWYYLNSFLKTLPRQVTSGPSGSSTANDLYREWWGTALGGSGPAYPVHRDLSNTLREFFYDLFTTQSESRVGTFDQRSWALAGGYPTQDVNDYFTPGGTFPNTYAIGGLFEPIGGHFTGSNWSWMDYPIVRWFTYHRPAGLLLGVIHKLGGDNAGWYYIWNKNDITLQKCHPITGGHSPDDPKYWDLYGWFSYNDPGFGGADRGAQV